MFHHVAKVTDSLMHKQKQRLHVVCGIKDIMSCKTFTGWKQTARSASQLTLPTQNPHRIRRLFVVHMRDQSPQQEPHTESGVCLLYVWETSHHSRSLLSTVLVRWTSAIYASVELKIKKENRVFQPVLAHEFYGSVGLTDWSNIMSLPLRSSI